MNKNFRSKAWAGDVCQHGQFYFQNKIDLKLTKQGINEDEILLKILIAIKNFKAFSDIVRS